jgi:glycosyltransferase involved in cell wall biosynthesis
MIQHILILSPDVITTRMAGPAIRYWEFAQQLAQHATVTLAIPNSVSDLSLPQLPKLPNLTVVQHEVNCIEQLIQQHDIIIFQGYIFDIYPQLKSCNKILVTDLYDPVPLEGLEQQRDKPADSASEHIAAQVNMLNQQLELADYFICASERQRDLWLGHLMALGRVNPYTYDEIKQRILIVPYGLPDQAPQHDKLVLRSHQDDSFILLWGGGIWQWFDPITPIKAVANLTSRYPKVKLVFLGTQHPNPSILPMPRQLAAQELANKLNLNGNKIIFQAGWIPYNQVHNYFLEANVGISAHFDTLETLYSFRTRILHYLWAGKPIITTAGDIFAEQIKTYQAGIVVDYNSEAAWEDAIEAMHDADLYAKYQRGVAKLARNYYWSNVTKPLKNLQQHASIAPDMAIDSRGLRVGRYWAAKWQHQHEYLLLQDQIKDQQQQYHTLQQKLQIIENSKSWKLTAYLRYMRRKLKF